MNYPGKPSRHLPRGKGLPSPRYSCAKCGEELPHYPYKDSCRTCANNRALAPLPAPAL